MSLERRGLGRGLSALLGEVESATPSAIGVREIPIELIRRNPAQPRTHFDETELEELASSMRQRGVLQPILVRPMRGTPGEYQIVAGERRWRAAQMAGLAAMPALVRELGDNDALEIAVVENIQRTDLDPLEEALAYNSLMSAGGHTQEEVALLVGKSRPHVANTMRLMQLPEAVRELVRSRQISAGHARALLGAAEPEVLARRIVDQGLTVRDAESLSKRGGAGAKPAAARKTADTLALERDLSERIGLKVEIADKDGAGQLTIRYRSLEQLDELCRRIMR